MGKLLKYGAAFMAGVAYSVYVESNNINDGEVIYDGEDFYVTAAKCNTSGDSEARVNYKKPQK